MKFNTAALCALLLLMPAVVNFTQTKAENDVRQLERAWLDAYEKHDTKAMQAIVSDDFLITFADGSQQTKADILEMIKRPVNTEMVNKFSTVNVKSRAYGDTVILTGRVVTEYKRNGALQKEES